eukprot:CAMPEP_0167769812 /NCGR_PEP_ID=MMETSP0110_2-20121227/17546_1 /TAXON_ID=629695 /ORGANISM="Gymnochlora sp., Strain CCMP2014" /LENGTH=587 /DNA_ID=CAMNT_0007658869 /DNA_START=200 /DNA_END=1963 /DNA_ORIENTATION=+
MGSDVEKESKSAQLDNSKCVCFVGCPTNVSFADICQQGEVDPDVAKRIFVIDDPKTNKRMVLIIFKTSETACMLTERVNGNQFKPDTPETCHAVYVKAVHILKSGLPLPYSPDLPLVIYPTQLQITGKAVERSESNADTKETIKDSKSYSTPANPPPIRRINSTSSALSMLPDPNYFELPTCTICIERLDSCVSGLLMPFFPATKDNIKDEGDEKMKCESKADEKTQLERKHVIPKKSMRAPIPPDTSRRPKVAVPSRDKVPEVTGRGSMGNISVASGSTIASENSTMQLLRWQSTRCLVCDSVKLFAHSNLKVDQNEKKVGPIDTERIKDASSRISLCCVECQNQTEKETTKMNAKTAPWICLVCGHVGCGRFEKSHAVRHFERTGHRFSLSLKSEAIWDYEGDGYVHRLLRHKTRGFSHPYVLANDVKEAGQAVTGHKLKAISGHYNHLLKVLLTKQQEHYLKEISHEEVKVKDIKGDIKSAESLRNKLKDKLQRIEKGLRGNNKKIDRLQKNIDKEKEHITFLKDLNDTLLKGLPAPSRSDSKRKGGDIKQVVSSQQSKDIQNLDARILKLEKEVQKLMNELDD